MEDQVTDVKPSGTLVMRLAICLSASLWRLLAGKFLNVSQYPWPSTRIAALPLREGPASWFRCHSPLTGVCFPGTGTLAFHKAAGNELTYEVFNRSLIDGAQRF